MMDVLRHGNVWRVFFFAGSGLPLSSLFSTLCYSILLKTKGYSVKQSVELQTWRRWGSKSS